MPAERQGKMLKSHEKALEVGAPGAPEVGVPVGLKMEGLVISQYERQLNP